MGVSPGPEAAGAGRDRQVLRVHAVVSVISLLGGIAEFGRFFETQGRISDMRNVNGHYSQGGCSDSCMLEVMAWMPLIGWVGALLFGAVFVLLLLLICHASRRLQRKLEPNLRALALANTTLIIIGTCSLVENVFELSHWSWVADAAVDTCCRCSPQQDGQLCLRYLESVPDDDVTEGPQLCDFERCHGIQMHNREALPSLRNFLIVSLFTTVSAVLCCCTGLRLVMLAESSYLQFLQGEPLHNARVGCLHYERVGQGDPDVEHPQM